MTKSSMKKIEEIKIYFVIGIILSISIRYLHEENLKLIVVIKLCTTLILRLL